MPYFHQTTTISLNPILTAAFLTSCHVSSNHINNKTIATGGPPLGYFDWNMIEQAAWGGVESAFLFGATSLAMEFAFKQKWISKFD